MACGRMNFAAATISSVSGAETMVSTTYSCVIDESKANICVELKSREPQAAIRPNHAWFFVIDVSASMAQSGMDGMKRIDRVKVFASIAKDLISDDDLLSVISFSSFAETNMKLTKMNSQEKSKVADCIQELKVHDMTSIEVGLVLALQEIRSAKQSGDLDSTATSSIILFTDGGANHGITDGEEMVKKYRKMENAIGDNVRVPISAFTVGDACSDFMMELSSRLGSEAFYWLDESKDFEADVMLPITLRQNTLVNDVRVVIESVNGAVIAEKTEEHLLSQSEKQLEYFVHMLPMGTSKVFQVVLDLQFFRPLERRDRGILDVKTTYCDGKGEKPPQREQLKLVGKSIFDTCPEALASDVNWYRSEALKQISAFKYSEGSYLTTWNDAKQAILENSTSEILRKLQKLGPVQEERDNFYDYVTHSVQTKVASIIRNQKDPDFMKWKKEIRGITEELQHCSTGQPARWSAMTKALARDMPAPTGVFSNMSKYDGKIWVKEVTDLVREAKATAESKNGRLDYESVRRELNSANSKERFQVVKYNLVDVIKKVKNNLKHVEERSFESKLFLGYSFFLSAKLRYREVIARRIENNRGEIAKDLHNTRRMKLYVVMKNDGALTDSKLFSEAKEKAKVDSLLIDIVKKEFLDKCCEEERVLFWHKYSIKK